MSITYLEGNPSDYKEELMPLIKGNYSDDPRAKDIPMDVDWSTYDTLYKEGRLVSLFAKDGDTIVGYLVAIVSEHHHVSKPFGQMDVIYVSPEYRGRDITKDLIEMAEETLIDANVFRFTISLRNKEMADKVIGNLGYKESEVIYSKTLGKV